MRQALNTFRKGLPAAILAALVVAGCTSAPVTGRSQFILISPQQSQALGISAYQQIKQQTPVVTGTEQARMVERIGQRIAAIAPGTSGYAWEFNLFRDPTPNAFALPGGKVGVNTGLFDVAENEAQLAAVMAHEVGHVVAQHSAERMSRDMVAQLGIGAIGAATASPELTNLAAAAATLGVTLPFTRSQEAEADRPHLYGACGVRPARGGRAMEEFPVRRRVATARLPLHPSQPRKPDCPARRADARGHAVLPRPAGPWPSGGNLTCVFRLLAAPDRMAKRTLMRTRSAAC